MFGDLCLKCKGSRNLCNLGYCPLLKKVSDILPKVSLDNNILAGFAPPSVFVGHYGYPKVFVGPMVSQSQNIEEPEKWFGLDMNIIAAKGASLFRPSIVANIRESNRIIEAIQEIALSSKEVTTEVYLERSYHIKEQPVIDFLNHPLGPRLYMKRFSLSGNTHIENKVEYIVSDKDLNAEEAVYLLYLNNFSVSHIVRILSAGLLGKSNNKKLVPTRWTITAVDDMISKRLIKEVKMNNTIDQVEYFYSSYLGNSFHIFLIPDVWSFEMLETWVKGAFYASANVVSEDYEGYEGRKDYASNITGAYYSARLAVLEHLKKIGKQASVLIYREVSPEYSIPLGVWLIRETIRNAMRSKPILFENMKMAVQYAMNNTLMKNWNEKSQILKLLNTQKKLTDF